MKDLKSVYQADTEELALSAMDVLEENWGKKYPSSIASWRNNWPQLSTYFKYPAEIRKVIYTTNSIENYNRQLRKVTKTRTVFPTNDALFKLLYLAIMDITKKWTGKAWNWGRRWTSSASISGTVSSRRICRSWILCHVKGKMNACRLAGALDMALSDL